MRLLPFCSFREDEDRYGVSSTNSVLVCHDTEPLALVLLYEGSRSVH